MNLVLTRDPAEFAAHVRDYLAARIECNVTATVLPLLTSQLDDAAAADETRLSLGGLRLPPGRRRQPVGWPSCRSAPPASPCPRC